MPADIRTLTKLLPKIAYPVLRGPLRGARFILGALAGEGGGARVYFNRVEPEQTRVFAATVSKGQVVFDIGANVGYYTILASRLVGARGIVVAFEPVARNLSYLYRHIGLNRANNVMIVPVACSDALSLGTFDKGINYALGHLHSDTMNCRLVGSKNRITLVPTVDVDSVVERLGYSPHVVKIDVEGAELLVLHGMRNTLLASRPTLFLSVHSSDLRSRCLAHLADMGYTAELLGRDEKEPKEFLVRYLRR